MPDCMRLPSAGEFPGRPQRTLGALKRSGVWPESSTGLPGFWKPMDPLNETGGKAARFIDAMDCELRSPYLKKSGRCSMPTLSNS